MVSCAAMRQIRHRWPTERGARADALWTLGLGEVFAVVQTLDGWTWVAPEHAVHLGGTVYVVRMVAGKAATVRL